jgi:hypothetical protein
MLAHSNPEIAGAVADESRKAAFRVPSTNAPLATRLPAAAGHSISNRHSITPLLRPNSTATHPSRYSHLYLRFVV